MDKFLEYRKDEELDSLLRRVYKKYYHKYSLAVRFKRGTTSVINHCLGSRSDEL